MRSPGDRSRPRERALLVAGAVMFVVVTVALVAWQGLATSRDLLFLWLLLGLLALSLSDVKRWVRGVFFDWLPFMAILLFYDLSPKVSAALPVQLHIYPQIHADEALFGTPIPSVRLQHLFHAGPQLHWYDYATWFIYMTHLFATLIVAALLWRFAYDRFKRFRTLVVCLAGAGFVTYVLFPAVPPWMASKWHDLGYTYRIFSDVWHDLGVKSAGNLLENGSAFYNQVAAVPSLHAAYPLLITLFFWSTARWWARLSLLGYTFIMGFTLVYTAEHYAIDVLLGWTYAAGTFAAVTATATWWERRSRRAAVRARPGAKPAPVLERTTR
ncbi:MAG: hypothetical protein QOK04_555 [Solirubrobacteraceae bacterium]|jgi:hypothetical protein|nr:hypothetical protein [Solirubrobacteraceae bacterium]